MIAAECDREFCKTRGVTVSIADGIGGFIAESDDKKTRIDFRFETLLLDMRQRSVGEIATELFRGMR